jgi:hypothetical protein
MSPYHSLFDKEPAAGKVSLRPDYDYNAFNVDAHAGDTNKRALLGKKNK